MVTLCNEHHAVMEGGDGTKQLGLKEIFELIGDGYKEAEWLKKGMDIDTDNEPLSKKHNKGEQEQKCLDSIREIVFNPLIIDSDGCLKPDKYDSHSINSIVNSELWNNIHGIENAKLKKLLKTLFFAKPNENRSAFPDFKFEDWFVEHFQVSSTLERKKGSLYAQEQGKYQKKFQNPCDSKHTRSCVIDLSSDKFTHDNIKYSILNNLDHHLDSMDKYDRVWNYGCFVMEYRENGLFFDEERRNPYRIAKDVELLRDVYNRTSLVGKELFLVFKNGNNVEMISCESIPQILDKFKTVDDNQKFYGTGIIQIGISETIGEIL